MFSCENLFILSLVKINEAQLNKRSLYGGLGHLDLSFLRSPTHFASGGGDRHACHSNGAASQDVFTVTCQGSGTQPMTLLCMCQNAVTGASYTIDLMGKVPYPVRRFNRGMISSTAGSCGGTASCGAVSFYCESNMHIHESAQSIYLPAKTIQPCDLSRSFFEIKPSDWSILLDEAIEWKSDRLFVMKKSQEFYFSPME